MSIDERIPGATSASPETPLAMPDYAQDGYTAVRLVMIAH